MKILTDNEIEFLLDYYKQIIRLTKSTGTVIIARYYRRQIVLLKSCPWKMRRIR